MPFELQAVLAIVLICLALYLVIKFAGLRLAHKRAGKLRSLSGQHRYPRGTSTMSARTTGSRRHRDEADPLDVFDDVSLADRGPGRARPTDPGIDDVAPARLRVIGGGDSHDSGDSGGDGGD